MKESKINPVLVKGKTTELPKVVKDHLEKIKQEEQIKKRNSLSPLTRAAVNRAAS